MTHVAYADVEAGDSDQDRVRIYDGPDGALILALADGAGGTGGGAEAADAIVAAARGGGDFAQLLAALDRDGARLGFGQATAVLALLTADRIVGASVGDSGAWLVTASDRIDLTAHQQRKPLVGDGCTPVAFSAAVPPGATILIASDGLLRYAPATAIAAAVRAPDLRGVPATLIDLVRLRNGRLQDDVSLIVARAH
ncbi:MAG TPA: SpoIIE family protein phosphatase [Kofleriaceae bacterium]